MADIEKLEEEIKSILGDVGLSIEQRAKFIDNLRAEVIREAIEPKIRELLDDFVNHAKSEKSKDNQ